MQRETPLHAESIQPEMCSTEFRLQILSRLPFFAGLPQTEMAAVNSLFQEQGYQPEESIYFAGDPPAFLYVVAVGKVKLLRHTLGGQDVLLEILAPGELFGTLAALGDKHYTDTAQAQTICCVLAIGTDDFQQILHRFPTVALNVLNIIAERLQEAYDTIRQLSADSAERRIAATLLKLAEKMGEQRPEGILIQMPLSRQDIAAMTGTTPETASRILSHFRKAKLVRSGRQWIALVDPVALAAIVGEENSKFL
jgi:CRP/FNR family transcriptional regulator, nitrogen oxide reductase regulator